MIIFVRFSKIQKQLDVLNEELRCLRCADAQLQDLRLRDEAFSQTLQYRSQMEFLQAEMSRINLRRRLLEEMQEMLVSAAETMEKRLLEAEKWINR